jgi:ribosomal protein L13E
MEKSRQDGWLTRWQRRFDRRPPVAETIYGRRPVPAKGFSAGELEQAGLDAASAASLGLAVDAERMSALGNNVESLKRFLERREKG